MRKEPLEFVTGTTSKIDPLKTYRLKNGDKVKLATIDDEIVYGFRYTGSWIPMMWSANTGYPIQDVIDSDLFVAFSLVEVKPVRQLSVTIYVGENGHVYTESTIAKNAKLFGSFTVNLELEQHSFDKVYTLC